VAPVDQAATQAAPVVPLELYAQQLAPGFLRGDYGQQLMRSLGILKDLALERARRAVRARMPTLAPYDALPLIGDERQIDAVPGEPAAAYAERLRNAWDTWRLAGLPLGVLRALRIAGFPTVTLLQMRRHSFTLDADSNLVVANYGAPVDQGYTPANYPATFWNAFGVVISEPFGWSGAVPADGSATAELCRRVLKRWKPAHAICDTITIVTGIELWDWPAGSWDEAGGHWLTDGEAAAGVVHWTPPVG
jgi:hypothetical protein